ncbi:MAG: gliding motility-associated C-terminal domain-containing protein [Bacteroidetes bacterium]|nr:MAG: gliding motility-associated C-terminal domain-containing protein [Bacteroidota bacterium]
MAKICHLFDSKVLIYMDFPKIFSFFVNVSLILFPGIYSYSQESYNDCSKALEICPGINYTVTNVGANKTLCNDCEDDFSLCFSANNTIWLKFTTNEFGGGVNISFSKILFDGNKTQEIEAAIISAVVPCDASTYSDAGSCRVGQVSDFSLATNLAPNQEYYIVLNGGMSGNLAPGEFQTDLILSGNGVNRIVPSMDIESDKPFYCKNDIATFTAHLSQCPDSSSYMWYINDTLVAVTIDSIYQTSALENGDVVSVTNSCFTQCVIHPEGTTGMLPVFQFDIDAGPDQYMGPEGFVQLQGTTEAPSYYWSPTEGISDPNQLSTVVFPTVTTTYTLTGTLNGCTLSDQMTVFLEPLLVIPKAFTPNDDGANDTWVIPGIELYPNCTVQIYDRWGQKVFATTGYNKQKAWDGKRNGHLLNESTYFYIIELRDAEKQVLKGNVSIVK